jgi:hypothetical protein
VKFEKQNTPLFTDNHQLSRTTLCQNSRATAVVLFSKRTIFAFFVSQIFTKTMHA